MTKRQQLIHQMRKALNDLQNPSHFDMEETLVFEILDTEFELTEEQLEEETPDYEN